MIDRRELLEEKESRQKLKDYFLGRGVDDVALCETRELVFVLLLSFKEWQVG